MVEVLKSKEETSTVLVKLMVESALRWSQWLQVEQQDPEAFEAEISAVCVWGIS